MRQRRNLLALVPVEFEPTRQVENLNVNMGETVACHVVTDVRDALAKLFTACDIRSPFEKLANGFDDGQVLNDKPIFVEFGAFESNTGLELLIPSAAIVALSQFRGNIKRANDDANRWLVSFSFHSGYLCPNVAEIMPNA